MRVVWNKGIKMTDYPQCGFRKGNINWKYNIGRKFLEETKQKMALAKLGKIDEKTNHWKGENIKYRGLHMWIVSRLGQPDNCENCEKSGLNGHDIHWANKSREYKRDLTDWIRLCVRCHKAYDRKKSYSYSI